jgi:uncharacterized RDD family membrane protein YckC
VTNHDADLPEGPLDPFDDDAQLAPGPDDVGFLRVPTAGARLLSSLIDIFFIAICFVVPATIIPVLVLHPVKGQKFTPAQNRTIELITLAVALVVWVGCVALERLGRGLPGRRLLRLRLVTLSGERPTWGRLMIRYAPLLLVALLLIATPVVFLAVMYGGAQAQRRDGLDLLAGTRVVVDVR